MRHNKNRRQFHLNARREDSSEWLVSYSDVVTVLLCFFIIFYAAKQKFSAVKQDEMEAIVQLLSNVKDEGDGKSGKSQVKDYVNRQVNRRKLLNEVKSNINIQMNDKEVNIITEANKVHIQFDKIEFFKAGSTKLTKNGKEVIDNLIKIIHPYKDKLFISIEGYSDSTPIKRIVPTRKWNTNMELSLNRSLTVNSYFLGNGFDKKQMSISGFGSNRPLLAEELAQEGRDIATATKDVQRRVSISLSAK